MFVSKEDLERIKEGHQEYLLNTKYLHSHIMLVLKENLENIKEDCNEYF